MRGLGLTEGDDEDSGSKSRHDVPRFTFPAVEDRYVLLAIHYMNICVQGVVVGGVESSLVLI
jgi:hypothetical protein